MFTHLLTVGFHLFVSVKKNIRVSIENLFCIEIYDAVTEQGELSSAVTAYFSYRLNLAL